MKVVYEVEVYNMVFMLENKIYDDEIVKKFGFVGGLVFGVEVFVYMVYVFVVRWGLDWFCCGDMIVWFGKFVYDG